METTDQFARRMRAMRAGRSVRMQKQLEFRKEYADAGEVRRRQDQHADTVREMMNKHTRAMRPLAKRASFAPMHTSHRRGKR